MAFREAEERKSPAGGGNSCAKAYGGTESQAVWREASGEEENRGCGPEGWVGRSHHKEFGLYVKQKSLWGVLVRALTAFREQSAWGPDTAWCGRRLCEVQPEPASPVGNHHAKVRSVTIMQPYIKCTPPAPTPRLVVKHNDCSSLHAIQDHC